MEWDDIRSLRMRKEVRRVLNDPDPLHNERLWLAGFLGYITRDPEEVCQFIAKYNHWEDYDPYKTKVQVYSVFRNSKTLSSHT